MKKNLLCSLRSLRQILIPFSHLLRASVVCAFLLASPSFSSAALEVVNGTATNITSSNAVCEINVLQGFLTGNATATVYYGATNWWSVPSAWAYSNQTPLLTATGLVSLLITNLQQQRTYYWRTYITDPSTFDWAPVSSNFTTTSGPAPTAIPGAGAAVMVGTNGILRAPVNFLTANGIITNAAWTIYTNAQAIAATNVLFRRDSLFAMTAPASMLGINNSGAITNHGDLNQTNGILKNIGGTFLDAHPSAGGAGAIYINGGGTGAGGDIWTYGDGDDGGYIHTESGENPGTQGGYINTAGNTTNGGNIDTSNGGGSIDTTGTGSIQYGALGTRTTVSGQAATDIAILLPTESGELSIDTHLDGEFWTTNSAIVIGTNSQWIPLTNVVWDVACITTNAYEFNTNGTITVLAAGTGRTRITVDTTFETSANVTHIAQGKIAINSNIQNRAGFSRTIDSTGTRGCASGAGTFQLTTNDLIQFYMTSSAQTPTFTLREFNLYLERRGE